MRLGGPLFESFDSPEAWAAAVGRQGYRAAYCPVPAGASDDVVAAYAAAALQADIVIAEVGAWSNPISPDEDERKAAMEKCVAGLELAERIGAACCVNIAGSRNPEKWDGPHPDNLADETFDAIVESVQTIIDRVRPRRARYALETMPWVPPDSPASYERLIRAIDRPAFGVHLDPVNLVNSPARAFDTRALLDDCFQRLGSRIVSCHAKDIRLDTRLTVHLDECRPGTGVLDYPAFLRGVKQLGREVPVMLEHLPTADEYRAAAAYVRSVMEAEGIPTAGR